MIDPKAVVAGIVAGVAGAAIWAAIAYFADYEIGWIAWGIGAAVGGAMIAVAKKGSMQLGVVAVVIALLSILGGKFVAYQVIMGSTETDEFVITFVADEVIALAEEEGEQINWPAGAVPYEGVEKADYPPEYWVVAEEAWAQMSEQERQAMRDDVLGENWSFTETFGLFDLLFFGLAIVTSFKLGVAGTD